ncbi:MAG: Planctomycete cytochrome [Phycisphaerales bacterium]|nr:Planctomycete cytochrome [Phycisphaerales bacterium]
MGRLTKGTRWMVLSAAAATFSIAGVFVAGSAARAADAPANPEGVKLFEAKIRPILAQNCVGCHGPDKQKGKLRMDTREALLKGGMDEEKVVKVIEPGDPAKSMIIEAVNYKNEDIQMPPPKKKESRKLSDEQIKDLTEWVKLGAPYGEKPVEAPPKAADEK